MLKTVLKLLPATKKVCFKSKKIKEISFVRNLSYLIINQANNIKKQMKLC